VPKQALRQGHRAGHGSGYNSRCASYEETPGGDILPAHRVLPTLAQMPLTWQNRTKADEGTGIPVAAEGGGRSCVAVCLPATMRVTRSMTVTRWSHPSPCAGR